MSGLISARANNQFIAWAAGASGGMRTGTTAADTLKLYLEAYGAAAEEDGRKRLRIDFFVMRDGKLFLGVPASFLRPENEPVGITGQIPLRKCSPGEYRIRVRVTDETTGARAETETSFAIHD